MGDAAEKQQVRMLVQLTDEELTALVRRAVDEALAARDGAPANTQQLPSSGKRTMKTTALAQALGKSTRTIANWIVQGVPQERVGHDYRFNLEEVKAWIAERKRKKAG